jgi:HEAT repeat protein
VTLPPGSELALPASQVEELIRTMVKGVRAFQMYLPNNPVYQRSEQAIRDAFLPIWSNTQKLVLSVVETDLIWEEHVVYRQPTKGESFAWMLYKDGLRLLTLKPGVEKGELVRFLQVVSHARLLSADAADDLLTLLWEEHFHCIDYLFAEITTDQLTVLDPQMMDLGRAPDPLAQGAVVEQVRSDAVARQPGAPDPDEFDSTLYFLEEQETLTLRRQVDEEYARDSRQASLDALLDIFELQPSVAVREEVLGIFESLLPNLLTRGEFRAVARLLRDFRTIGQRVTVLDPANREKLQSFQARLSQPAILSQLLQSMEESATDPEDDDIGEVLGELQAEGLETMLRFLPGLKRPAIRRVLETSVDRLGAAHTETLLDILAHEESPALVGAAGLCRRLKLQVAVPGLERLVAHRDAEVRLAVVEALAEIGSAGALTALERALDDSERMVRLAAVGAVMGKGYRGALRRLEAVVLGKGGHELERAERRQFFEAYAVVAGAPALGVLTDILEPRGLFRHRESTETRTCAAYAIARLRTPEARAVLERIQQDKQLSVRNAATRALREWPA